MPSSPAELILLVDDPKPSYVPGDKLTGQVVLMPKTSLDASEIGIKFHGFESVRYNSQVNVNPLFSYTQILFTGPYTLRADKHSYPFEFEFPATTNPPEEIRYATFETRSCHTLPSTTNHVRRGVTYSFNAIIEYELLAWVKKPKMLEGGDKVALKTREGLIFWPIDCDSDALQPRYQNYYHFEMVPCDSRHVPENEKGKEKAAEKESEEEEQQQQQQKQPGPFSRFFSLKKDSFSLSRLPRERVEVHIQIPTAFNRRSHNPISLYVTYPPKKGIPPVKLRSLLIELKATMHVPCMETTIYGAKPGVDDEIFPLMTISKEDRSLEIPQEGGSLEINLFGDPLRQFARCTPDFTTFNMERKHSLSVKCGFQCGGQIFESNHTDLPVMMPLASTRAPAELPPPDPAATADTEKYYTTGEIPGIFYRGKGDAGSSRDDEPPPPYEP